MQPIVVFDTNVLLSALFSKNGDPARCVLLAKERQIKSITCQEILDEFQEMLLGKFRFSEEMATTAIDELKDCSQLVTISNQMVAVVSDLDDNKVLECAVVGSAQHLITGDKRHLLPLKQFQGIEIVQPTVFLEGFVAHNPF